MILASIIMLSVSLATIGLTLYLIIMVILDVRQLRAFASRKSTVTVSHGQCTSSYHITHSVNRAVYEVTRYEWDRYHVLLWRKKDQAAADAYLSRVGVFKHYGPPAKEWEE
jgi:uncharacterized membrane protein YqjE